MTNTFKDLHSFLLLTICDLPRELYHCIIEFLMLIFLISVLKFLYPYLLMATFS